MNGHQPNAAPPGLSLVAVMQDFPGLGGGSRIKIVKRLPAHGVQPIVVTDRTSEPRAAVPGIPVEETLCFGRTPLRVVSKLTGKRAHGLYLESLLFAPDLFVNWVPFAFLRARRIIRRTGARVVFTTSPPESVHLTGLLLKRYCGVRWIADFRDLWTTKGVVYQPPTRLHDRFARRLERTIYREADVLIANTQGNLDHYVSQFGLDPARILLLPGCYGYEDEIQPGSGATAPRKPGPLRVGYMGRFDKNGFPWEVFAKCVREASAQPGGAGIQVHLCGSIAPATLTRLHEMGLRDQLVNHGVLLHSEAMDRMRECDVLLLTMYETSYSHAIVPHKLYYYLALRKPILAIAQRDGEAARITEAAEAGVVASSTEPARITDAMIRWSREVNSTGRLSYQGREEEIAKYSADRRARLLADTIRSLSGLAPDTAASAEMERQRAVS